MSFNGAINHFYKRNGVDFMKRFDPEKFRYQMAMHGFNIRTLARYTGIHENTVGNISRGTSVPHSDTLGKLVSGIGCKYEDLFTEEPPKKE